MIVVPLVVSSLLTTLIRSSVGLNTLTQAGLNAWVVQAQAHSQGGQLPNYIPMLAGANRSWFALQIQTVDGQIYTAGEVNLPFALMSAIKPFVLLFLLQQLGKERVFSHVGMSPSDQPFNCLTQLETDRGFPIPACILLQAMVQKQHYSTAPAWV